LHSGAKRRWSTSPHDVAPVIAAHPTPNPSTGANLRHIWDICVAASLLVLSKLALRRRLGEKTVNKGKCCRNLSVFRIPIRTDRGCRSERKHEKNLLLEFCASLVCRERLLTFIQLALITFQSLEMTSLVAVARSPPSKTRSQPRHYYIRYEE
jgi:hypothetical protein